MRNVRSDDPHVCCDRREGGWHTFASRAVQANVPLAKVARWLGHSTTKMTERYVHLAHRYDPEIELAL